jgi:hypothetical protein
MTERSAKTTIIKKGERGDVLFIKTVLPHQLTEKPPLGSWSAKKMVNSDNTVPVHNPDINQYPDLFKTRSSVKNKPQSNAAPVM